MTSTNRLVSPTRALYCRSMGSVRHPYRASRVNRGHLHTVGWASSSGVAKPAMSNSHSHRNLPGIRHELSAPIVPLYYHIWLPGCIRLWWWRHETVDRCSLAKSTHKIRKCIRLCTITVNKELRQFRQTLFAFVAYMIFGQPIGLLQVKQPHDSFLTYLLLQV